MVITCLSDGAGSPCCSEPCQNRGVCTPIGTESYECDCTRTGYAGPNCTTRTCSASSQLLRSAGFFFSWFVSCSFFWSPSLPAEFLTWIKASLKPSPNTVHYLLTHFKGFWNIINSVSFLRDAIMRYVLTCESPTGRSGSR